MTRFATSKRYRPTSRAGRYRPTSRAGLWPATVVIQHIPLALQAEGLPYHRQINTSNSVPRLVMTGMRVMCCGRMTGGCSRCCGCTSPSAGTAYGRRSFGGEASVRRVSHTGVCSEHGQTASRGSSHPSKPLRRRWISRNASLNSRPQQSTTSQRFQWQRFARAMRLSWQGC
jgi:hypothetical protein